MPSLRMKKSNMCCLREKSSLRVCHMSRSIAKKSPSNLKIFQSEEDASIGCWSCQDASPKSYLNVHDDGTVGVTICDELLGGEDVNLNQLGTSSEDSVKEGKELQSASCSSNQETIFSPSVAQNGVNDAPDSCDNAGANVDEDNFHLRTADESDGNSGRSSDNQTCTISDFYVSDMVLAALPFVGGSLLDVFTETLMFPEYDTAESNIFFNVTDNYVEPSERVEVCPSEKAKLDCDNSSFMFAIHQVRQDDSDEAQYFDPHLFIRNLPDLSDVLPDVRPTIPPKESREKKPITLVLDLDETLVHSTLENCKDADFTFTVFFNMRDHTVYVKERPHLHTFLKKVAEMFEVIVFTASQSIYAEKLLDILDPDGKLISGRAYRESCIFSDGNYTKDLTVLGLDLAKVAIIDNSPQVFRLQVNNGIPIKSWFNDPSDNELLLLIPFLETLAESDDVRPLIAKRFGNYE